MGEQYYSEEQAQEILRVASRASLGFGEISRERLLETAAELGIRPEDVLRAEAIVREKQQFELDRAAFRKHIFKKFWGEVSGWLSCALLLYGIAFVTNGFELRGLIRDWPIWPVGIWGLFLLKDILERALDLTVNRETAFEKWRQKQANKSNGVDKEPVVGFVARIGSEETDAKAVEGQQVRS